MLTDTECKVPAHGGKESQRHDLEGQAGNHNVDSTLASGLVARRVCNTSPGCLQD